MLQPHRLRAPRADGALLEEPALAQTGPLLDANREFLNRWDHDFQGRSFQRLRAMARAQVLNAAQAHLERFGFVATIDPHSSAPLIVTGHQPELFHPGVWVKNFATAALADRHGGQGLNLIVDNDIPKGPSLRVPRLDNGRLRAEAVDFDTWSGEAPFEDALVDSESTFASFGEHVLRTLDGLIPEPMIADAWPRAMKAAALTDRFGLRFSAARRGLEEALGTRNAEVPLSAVCETEAFGWFASHLLAQLPRFQEVHNTALSSYRALYKIRSKNHPVPKLDREGDWLESPFWAWRTENPRRRPLLARQNDLTLDLRIAGEPKPFGTLPLSPDRDACCAVEEMGAIARRGIRIRTRALTTTMFARLLLGDLFLHGIGGAKYDELGDEVIRGFFGIDPPGYLTTSMTLWLGVNVDPSASSRLASSERTLRDLRFNPDRFLGDSDDPEVQAWIGRKREALAASIATRRDRAGRFRKLRAINDALGAFVADRAAEVVKKRDESRDATRRTALGMGREWSFVVHSRPRFEAAIGRALAPLHTS